jgi:type IV pilus assembly protein PilM
VAKKITTLFINDKSIRLMVTSGRRISKLAEVPLDMDLESVSDEDKESELVEKIKHLFSANKISPNRFIFGMSGLHCLSRPVVLPLLPRAMQEEAMTREAKRLLPVPPEQLHISWQIVSSDESHMLAFIIAMPRQATDNLLRALERAGLRPYMMDIKPLALARLIKEETAILIDVQESEFDIVILSDGFPQPMRTVSFSGESLSYGEKLSIIKDELRRTVQFYNSNNPEKTLPEEVTVYISGEIAENPDSYGSISQELGYPIAPLTSPLKCPKQLDPSHYLVNVGLALKELPREAGSLLANINTLPGALLPKPISRTRVMAIPGVVAGIGVIVAFVFVIQSTAGAIESTGETIDANRFIISKKQAEQTRLMESIAVMEEDLGIMEGYLADFIMASESITIQGNAVNYDMKAAVNNLVDGIEYQDISYSPEYLVIEGNAPSEEEVLEYAARLRDTNRFSEVVISRIQYLEASEDPDVPYYFSLTLIK